MKQRAIFMAATLAVGLVVAAAGALQAQASANNPELERLHNEDQADREAGPNAKIDWQAVSKRDAERRARVREIVDKGGATTSTDYYHAAMVYQHGTEVPEYEEAHRLAMKAVELDAENDLARWLAAASKDRSLMWQGKPQLYGTQFKKVDDRWVLWEVDPSITDEERAKWNVPPLAEQKKKVETLNAPRQ